jgi:GAF domain-containing protein
MGSTEHDQRLAEIFAEWAAMAIKKTRPRFEAKQSQEAALTVPADQAASA